MSSTNATELSKIFDLRARSRDHVVGIVARCERDGTIERLSRAIALA
jgi:hypothetical protein